MDKFDALLLDALQRDNRQTAEVLSLSVGLSPDACRKRLNRLRAAGYIEADIAILSPERLGRGLMLVVEVSLQNERPVDLDRFKARMHDAPEVMQCYYVTGNADFILILSARDMADYEAFTRRHFFAEDNVARFRTSAVMDRVKVGFALPVTG
jgi:Lrp/AsnC family leucine-responsive transcriptional regulator